MDFDQLFPSKNRPFSVNALASEAWIEFAYGKNAPLTGQLILLSGALFKACASWYEDKNLFTHPTFSLKLSRFREVCAVMAGNSSKDKKAAARPAWKGFLDFRLDDAQLQECDEWQPSAVEVFSAVDAIMLAGFRLTLSYNSTAKLANCTIIDDRSNSASAGFALSTADSSGLLALKAAVYKHSLVLQGDWTSLLDKPSAGGRRG